MKLDPKNHIYQLKRKMKMIGAAFTIHDMSGNVVGLCEQKAFRLKEDIRIYSDASKREEVMVIKARSILDFQAAYDIWDTQRALKVGALRRKGWSSLVRDEWEVLDPNDNPIGKVMEDNPALALVRRFLTALIPQNFDMVMFDGRKVVDFRQEFNPFFYTLTVDFSMDPQGSLDRHLGLAAAALICCIEGRQQNYG